MIGSIFNRFSEDLLSSCGKESSALAYAARLRHLEPLAEGLFSYDIVKDWTKNLLRTYPYPSARELVRLAKKFWEYGARQGEFSGANPFLTIKLNNKNAESHPHRITLERERERERESSLLYKEKSRYKSQIARQKQECKSAFPYTPYPIPNFLTSTQISTLLSIAPNEETRCFWALCALAGLRQSEAANLRWGQIIFSSLRAQRGNPDNCNAKIIGLPARNNAPDFVEISGELASSLRAEGVAIHKGDLLFPHLPKHASQRTRELQTAYRKAFSYTQYPKPHTQESPITFNLLRRSFGANLILAGESLETVRQKMRFAMLKDVALNYGDLLKNGGGK